MSQRMIFLKSPAKDAKNREGLSGQSSRHFAFFAGKI